MLPEQIDNLGSNYSDWSVRGSLIEGTQGQLNREDLQIRYGHATFSEGACYWRLSLQPAIDLRFSE
jgi:hypothetical protein